MSILAIIFLDSKKGACNAMSEAGAIINEVKKAVVDKDEVLVRVLMAMLAGGHILLEDIPGVGKTTMALAFSRALALKYNRMQFTPDVLPSDITGYSAYEKDTGKLVYKPGSILCNLFLADELNRATSRTQSALLEAMEEGQVTVDGISHSVPSPFIVIATQNPVGSSGTQRLPDSQMDRFMVKLSIGYPSPEGELEMMRRKQRGNPLDVIRPVLPGGGLEDMRTQVASVFIGDELSNYILTLIRATRAHPSVLQGASPRATLAVMSMSKATAWVQGRDYVLPSDVRYIFSDTITHRLILKPEIQSTAGPAGVVREIIKTTIAPRIN